MAAVSVVIPVYNTAEYLDQCMKSVLEQSFTDFEVILVDDGSTDSISSGMCDRYAEQDSRVHVIHKENGGLMSAWIAGVKEATAAYVAFIDSDDWVDTDMLGDYYAHIDSSFTGAEIISGNCTIEKGGRQSTVTQELAPGEYTGDALDKVRKNLLGNENRPVIMSRCMKLISRNLILDNLKYCDPRITMAEDVNITLPCLCDAKRLVILKGAHSYHYRQVGESISHAYNPKLLANLELTDRTFREILHEKKVSTADLQMDREFVITLLWVMKNEIRSSEPGLNNRVKKIFLREDIRKKLVETDMSIREKSNKLLYFTARHPNAIIIALTKAVVDVYDKRTN